MGLLLCKTEAVAEETKLQIVWVSQAGVPTFMSKGGAYSTGKNSPEGETRESHRKGPKEIREGSEAKSGEERVVDRRYIFH